MWGPMSLKDRGSGCLDLSSGVLAYMRVQRDNFLGMWILGYRFWGFGTVSTPAALYEAVLEILTCTLDLEPQDRKPCISLGPTGSPTLRKVFWE